MDRGPDADSFDWVLDDIKTLEHEINLPFMQLTGKNTKMEFVPPQWFVMQLEKEITAAMTPLDNPFPRVKEMTPPQMFALIMVKLPRGRNKVFECRTLYRTLLPAR